MTPAEDDDLAGLKAVSTDGEDNYFDAELADSETAASGAPSGRRAHRKRPRVNIESLPLMEGEGESFKVLGFNQSQRATFVQVLMRFGAGEFDWVGFVPWLKEKTYEEIKNYGQLFMSHIREEIDDLPTFSDGVPKDRLRVFDVRVRIGVLKLFGNKVKSASDSPENPLFGDDITSRYPTIKEGRVWKQEHDVILLRAVMKHGYRRWQDISDDKDLKIQEVICQELNQLQVGSTIGDRKKGTVGQRREVKFIKDRLLFLERALIREYQKEYYRGEDLSDDSEDLRDDPSYDLIDDQRSSQSACSEDDEADSKVAVGKDIATDENTENAEADSKVAVDKDVAIEADTKNAEADSKVAVDKDVAIEADTENAEADSKAAVDKDVATDANTENAEADPKVAVDQDIATDENTENAEGNSGLSGLD